MASLPPHHECCDLGRRLGHVAGALPAHPTHDPGTGHGVHGRHGDSGARLFVPNSLLLVALGFGLAAEGNWDLGETWIYLALAVFIASFITGAAFLGPESGRIKKLAAERGAANEEVQSRVARFLAISRIELVFLILVVLDMVIKPGL